MKALVLSAMMLVSATALARGSDYDWTCRVSGSNNKGKVVRYTLTGLPGGLGIAHGRAIRSCKQSGLSNCRASCSPQ